MFIAIYPDGSFVEKDNIKSAFELPGEKFVFKINDDQSDNAASFCKSISDLNSFFKYGYLELVGFKLDKRFGYDYCDFSIFNHLKNSVFTKSYEKKLFKYTLGYVVKEMIEISKFPSKDDYDENINSKKYKARIEELEKENIALKAQIINQSK